MPWRDLPERFGPGKSVYNRFQNWSRKGAWERIFKALRLELDDEGCIVDGTIIRAHQDAAGGKGGERNCLGRSRDGVSTKIHALVDTKGRPLHIALTQGHRHEIIAAPELLAHATGKVFIGDSGYDSNDLRAAIRKRGMFPVIPSRPERTRKLPKRRSLYARRYEVERFFHRLKRLRAIASRYDKSAASFLSLIHIGCAVLWLA